MRAVVVCESMYGNTHHVAGRRRAGLQVSFEVTVVPVAEAGPVVLANAGPVVLANAGPVVLANAGLVVVGGPIHAHGMSRAATRQVTGDAAKKPGNGMEVETRSALGCGWPRASRRAEATSAPSD